MKTSRKTLMWGITCSSVLTLSVGLQFMAARGASNAEFVRCVSAEEKRAAQAAALSGEPL